MYDLSGGLAASVSPLLLGRRIGGIWHTGVVVWFEAAGAEHYFGHGINSSLPGRSPFGRPTRVLEMGTTQVPKAVWEEYLFEMMGAWSELSLEALGPAFD